MTFFNRFTVSELAIGVIIGSAFTTSIFTGVVEIRINTPYWNSHPTEVCNDGQTTNTEAIEELGGTTPGRRD